MRMVLRRLRATGGPAANQPRLLLTRLGEWMNRASTSAFVVLALDAPRLEDGTAVAASGYFADNDMVARFCDDQPRTRFGASVHPYRSDACAELERLVARGACLVKWLPSYQRIDPASPRCIPFYDVLAHYRVPLLSHTGVEHLLPGGDQRFNDPERLTLALQRGVTVIAAHCGARLMLHERCRFEQWRKIALTHEQCFGDLSAMVLPIRVGILRRILASDELLAKTVYGSDFPAQAWPWVCVTSAGLRSTVSLARIRNPLERSAAAVRALGFPDAVFSRAWRLLRNDRHVDASRNVGASRVAVRGA